MTLVILVSGALLLSVLNYVSTPTVKGVYLRPWLGVAVSSFVAVTALLLLLGLTGRPWTSLGIGAALAVALWAGNKLKVRLLKEVLVFSDVFLAGHALRHPRLYFGYCPKWVGLVILGTAAAVCFIIGLEDPHPTPIERILFLLCASILIVGLCRAIVVAAAKSDGLFRTMPLRFNANADAAQYTPLGAVLLHVLWHERHRMALRTRFHETTAPKRHVTPQSKETVKTADAKGASLKAPETIPEVLPSHVRAHSVGAHAQKVTGPAFPEVTSPSSSVSLEAASSAQDASEAEEVPVNSFVTVRRSASLPTLKSAKEPLHHIVLIQAESFCRLKRAPGETSPTPTLDAMMAASPSGELKLDWQGAYTMRTEFSVLTGQKVTNWETYGFDPYRLCAMTQGESLASRFKAAGFRTVAWHPHAGEFFHRDAVMPNLGFDVFRSEDAFELLISKERYVSDRDLLSYATRCLAQLKKPTFLFIITMESHGPWIGEKDQNGALLSEVECYRRHLESLDKGVQVLKSAVDKGFFSATVGLYGDHLPALANTALLPQGPSWVIWNGVRPTKRQNLAPEKFSEAFYRSAL